MTGTRAWHEVRSQFKEIPGILEGKAKPDYKTCIEISTKRAIGDYVTETLDQELEELQLD
ncbi:MAG: sodium/proton-translocating pyrophosphatase [Clostridiales bacterium]|nr:sodium/proton-translocating pyrophosphatase [Clostridiales bacterium]